MILAILVRSKERLDQFRSLPIHYRPGTSIQVDRATRINGKQDDGRYEGSLLGREYFSEDALEDIPKIAQAA